MIERPHIITDSIHGDIHLSDLEHKIIATPSFQRLRRIKQLSMGQLTYPNATHTRFAHSLGVLRIMQKVIEAAPNPELSEEQEINLCLSALLHDIGHYPYSHLMETVDHVMLTEDILSGGTLDVAHTPYDNHEVISRYAITQRKDLLDLLEYERAIEVAHLFQGTKASDIQFSLLIHGSLDMDRLDYLMRDSNAVGVPYGSVDINYLLNNLKFSPKGKLGLLEKALPAAEQFLLARYFMHRTVYYHKTTMAFEEACRQLIRRIRNRAIDDPSSKSYGIPKDGNEVKELVESDRFLGFNDTYLDQVIADASQDAHPAIASLAKAILYRHPPKLLHEVSELHSTDNEVNYRGVNFYNEFKHNVKKLSEKYKIPIESFIYCEPKPIKFESRPGSLSDKEAKDLMDKENNDGEKSIKIFINNDEEPTSIVNVKHSIFKSISNKQFQYYRVYVVRQSDLTDDDYCDLQREVQAWDSK